MSSDTESHGYGTPQDGEPTSPADKAIQAEEQLRRQVAELEQDKVKQEQEHDAEVAVLRRNAEDAATRLRETEQLLQVSGDNALEVERLREELKNFREEASRFSREDDREIRQLKRENQDYEKKIEQLNSEVEELRNVIQEHIERLNGGSSGAGIDQTSALHQELRLVREQAETDLKQLRGQLRDRELSGSAETAENEVLRREILEYQRARDEQDKQLEEAAEKQRRLAEDMEQQNTETERLERALEIARSEADEHKLRRHEEVEVRRRTEALLNDAQQRIEDLQAASESRFASPTTHSGPSAGGGFQVKGMLVGAALAFVLAEGLSVVGGQGEILTGLIRGGQSPVVAPAVTTSEMDGERQAVEQSSIRTPPADQDVTAGTPAAEESGLPHEAPQGVGHTGLEPATGTIIQDRLRRGGHGPVMIYVRGGEFVMGHQRDQLARDERPPHTVRLARFAISRDEVTYADYAAFSRATGRGMPNDQGWGGGRRPVINVSWNDAEAYTRWLSQQSGRNYRLPTEAEWEFAAAGGRDSFYWWGYQLGEDHANCFDCGSRWDSLSTAPAGSFQPNPYGIHDTAGNVLEWTQDCYHHSYEGAPTDGSAWLTGECEERVARGGAYNTPGDSLRTTKRFHYYPETKLPILGFRVVRELE